MADSGYVSNERWILQACDTILTACECGYATNQRILTWCQYRAVSNTGKLTTTDIARVCAMYGMSTCCADVLARMSLERLGRLLRCVRDYLGGRMLTGLDGTKRYHMTVACGRLLAKLQVDAKYNQLAGAAGGGREAGKLLDECVSLVVAGATKEDERSASDSDDSDDSDEDDEVCCIVILKFLGFFRFDPF